MASKKKKKSDRNSLNKVTPKLYDLMVEEGLSELVWEEEDSFKIKIKRTSAYGARVNDAGLASAPKEKKKEEPEQVQEDFIYSPMSGIFYEAAQPGDPPFVDEGDKVKPDSTVCIIEAMKLMNEVRVEKPCEIVEVLVNNGEAVELNQQIFKIRRS